MSIESNVFKRGIIDFDKLESIGFVKNEYGYDYSIEFMNHFRANVHITFDGEVSGRIFDICMDDEYTNFRIDTLVGFAKNVRDEYILILEKIKRQVLIPRYFIYEQSNRITKLILDKYQVSPEFLWDSSPNFGVFRNHSSKKWFGIIMNIDKSKIIPYLNGEIEIINLKVNNIDIIKKEGIYPAYHMNKKSWVSIILDDTLSDDEIMKFIDDSFRFSSK